MTPLSSANSSPSLSLAVRCFPLLFPFTLGSWQTSNANGHAKLSRYPLQVSISGIQQPGMVGLGAKARPSCARSDGALNRSRRQTRAEVDASICGRMEKRGSPGKMERSAYSGTDAEGGKLNRVRMHVHKDQLGRRSAGVGSESG